MSSFGALAHIRHAISKRLGVKKIKIGHAGTLDPLATGVLVLCTGKKSGTSTLIFKRDGKYQAIAFKPSDKLVKMIEEIIAAVSAA